MGHWGFILGSPYVGKLPFLHFQSKQPYCKDRLFGVSDASRKVQGSGPKAPSPFLVFCGKTQNHTPATSDMEHGKWP